MRITLPTAAILREWSFVKEWQREVETRFRRHWGVHLGLSVLCGTLAAQVSLTVGVAAHAVCLVVLTLRHKSARRFSMAAFAVAFLQVWFLFPHLRAYSPTAAFVEPAGQSEIWEARVLEFRRAHKPKRVLVRVEGHDYTARIPATPFALYPGMPLQIMATFENPEPPTNPGQFDMPAFLKSKNLRGILKVHSVHRPVFSHQALPLLARVRFSLEEKMDAIIPPDKRAMTQALLLGDAGDIESSEFALFRATGLLHLLAISGQHIGVLSAVLLLVLGFLRLPRKPAMITAALLLLAYIPIAGGSISILRSGLMFACLLPCFLWERPASSLNNLFLALGICLLGLPYQLQGLGFQLSFCASFFLIYYAKPAAALFSRAGLPPVCQIVGTAIGLSAVAFLATAPIVAGRLHLLTPFSIPASVVSSPILGASLGASALGLLTGYLWVPLGELFGYASAVWMDLLGAVVKIFASLPGHSRNVAPLPPLATILLYLLLLGFPKAVRSGRFRPLLVFMMLASSFVFAGFGLKNLWEREGRVTFLDVGQGDAVLLELPHANLLIDAGPGKGDSGAGRNVIVPFLRHRGIDRLDRVIITHAHVDHFGGLFHILTNMNVGQVLYSGHRGHSSTWKALEDSLRIRGVPLLPVACGQVLYGSPTASLQVLAPCMGDALTSLNDLSVVGLLRIHGKKVMLTGDSERAGEAALLSRYGGGLKADILKAGHHGSSTSSTPAFLKAVAPEMAIISAGRKNRYGHPSPEVMERLNRQDIRAVVTKDSGAVTFKINRSRTAWSTFTSSSWQVWR